MLLNTMTQLLQDGHQIVLVGTCQESPEYGVSSTDFRLAAERLGVPFFNNPGINSQEVLDVLRGVGADIAVSVNWLTLIGAEATAAFHLGVLNAHAGDLPRYRGNACPNWAMLAGEEKATVAIHFMQPAELDSGDILLKREFPLTDATTIGEVYRWLENSIPTMFSEAISGLENGTLVPVPQPKDPSQSLRCYPRIPADSLLRWNESAPFLAKLVNASSEPFQGAYTYWNGKKLIVWKAYAEPHAAPALAVPGQVLFRRTDKGEVGVAAGKGVLVLQEVEAEDGGRCAASGLLRSTRIRLGMVCEDEVAALRQRLEYLEQAVARIGAAETKGRRPTGEGE